MVRKMAYVGSSYIVGLFFASFLGYGINLAASAVMAAVAVTVLALYKSRCMKIAVCILSAAAGMFLYGAYDRSVYQNIIKYAGCEVEVTGKITDVMDYSGDKAVYTVKGVINGDVTAEITFFFDSAFAVIGDGVSFKGKAEIPNDSYKFPARSYYKAKGIYLQVSGVSDFNYTENNGFSLKKTVYKYRDYILGVMNSIMSPEGSAVAAAMLFGDKSGIESEAKTLMYRAGIGHIMAVSGVHLSVVCSFLGVLISKLKVNKYLRFGLIMLPVFCFVLLAGMSNSVMRAAVMIAVVYGAELFHRRADTFNSLGIAVILLTVTSPFAVRDASFLLSAAGVFGIGVAAPAVLKFIGENHKTGKALYPLIASVCVTVVVFPVTVLFFDEVSVVSPISNLLLIPVCEIILIGGVIVTLTGGVSFIAVPVLKICDVCAEIVMTVSEFIGGLHFSYIPLGSAFAHIAVIAALGAITLIFAVSKKKSSAAFYSAAVLMLAVLSVNVYRHIPDGKITAAVIKENSAVTAVIHDKNSACIIDLIHGGKASDSVVKYLNRNGIYRIDALILNDNAVASGTVYDGSLKLFDVSYVFIPNEDIGSVQGNVADCEAVGYDNCGNVIELDGFDVTFTENGTVLISCCGSEIIMYGKAHAADGDKLYDAAVRYSGNDCTDAEADIIAAMSDRAKVVSEKLKTIYIGKSVKFVIDRDGRVYSEELF